MNVVIWVPWQDRTLEAAAGDRRLVVHRAGDGPPGPPEEVEFWALPHPPGPDTVQLLARMPRLRVVHLLSSGFDHMAPHIPAGVVLCNAPQLRAAPTAEAAMCLILASVNRMTEWFEVQRAGQWRWLDPRPGLGGRTVLLVGHGHVGRALHRMLDGFGVRVVPVARRSRDGVAGVEELPDLVSAADIVVLAAPLTDRTRHLFGAAVLDRMRPGALLVNVGRGELVDTTALLAALHAGRVAAALDVVDPEPLPAGHPLWSAPNVLISPHVGGNTVGLRAHATAFLAEQIGRFTRGEPLAYIAGEETRRSNASRRNSP
nr:NAD(P)-dependent oxidoreductase [uncultured Actinoplanes sp.]